MSPRLDDPQQHGSGQEQPRTLVVLPETSFFSTALMTPTATVWRMSRTAKRPSGGYAVKGSTHMGLVGTIFTYAASPGRMTGNSEHGVLLHVKS